LALQTGPESPIVSVRGERIGTWSVPPSINEPTVLAWSPDGRLMAMVLAPLPRPDGSATSADARVRFTDMTGTGIPVPADLPGFIVLGWRSPTSIVVQDWLADERADAIVKVSTVDGSRATLSRFTRTNSCEYGLQRCQAFRIQLATNLIPSAGIRRSNPDRGPLVPVAHAAPIVLVVLVAGVVAGIVVLRRQRRRRPEASRR
jgi:hypothetical protein